MKHHVEKALKFFPESNKSLRVLNVGFGLGIIDSLFQQLGGDRIVNHTIIEAHPDVYKFLSN